MAQRLSTAAANAAANAVVDLIDAGSGAGKLKIFSGAQGANADTDPAGTLLCTVTLVKAAFGDASGGVALMVDPDPVVGAAAGTAGCFMIEDSAGNNVFDGTVTATGGGGDLQLATTTISVGVVVDLSAYTYTQPKS